FNNDGFQDVLIGDGTDKVLYFRGSAAGVFELVTTITRGFRSPYGIVLADFDVDGDKDILLGSWGYPDQALIALFWNEEMSPVVEAGGSFSVSQEDRLRIYIIVIAITALTAIGGGFYVITREIQKRQITWKEFLNETWQVIKVSVSYAFGNIWHMKRRTITLIIGFAIGAALISSFVTWQDTAPRVAIKDALEEREYEIITQPGFPWQEHHLLENASAWLMNQRLIEHTEIVYHTMGLFGAYNLPRDYFFGISGSGGYSPTGILISDIESVSIVNETYLNTVADRFKVQGELKVDNETVILSYQLASAIYQTTGVFLEVGTYFNFSIAGALPNHPDVGPMYYGNFTPVEFSNIRVGGFYTRVPEDTPASLQFVPETLTDGLIMSRSLINYSIEAELEETQVLPKMFVRANRQELSKLSPRKVASELEALAGILKARFSSLQVTVYTAHLSEKVDLYWETNTIVIFLLVPAVALAGYLSVLCTNLVTRSRSPEVGILKSRGADHWELAAMFSIEYGILALLGTLIGSLFLGVLISASISAFSVNYAVDFNALSKFIAETNISLFAIAISLIYSFVVLAVVIMRQISFLMNLDVSEALQATTRKKVDFLKQWHFDFGGSFIAFVIWAIVLLNISNESLFGLSVRESQTGLLFIGVFIWFSLAASSGRLLIVRVLPNIMKFLHII
ncbi:MAG: FG-GAP-like repeat-containing protein, partial [Candidatus Hodarchaeota archaeon]